MDLPVRLESLNANFLEWLYSGRNGVGLEFDCPHCGDSIKVWFTNPLDGGPVKGPAGIPRWDVVRGKSIQDLTLHPSIRLDGHFHVHVVDGWLRQA
jgi:hypothetical protein